MSSKAKIAKEVRSYTEEETEKDLEKLKNAPIKKDIMKKNYGLKYLDNIFMKERLETIGKGGINFYEFVRRKNEFLSKKYIKKLYDYNKKANPNVSELKNLKQIFSLYFSSINQFKPTIAKYIYGKYKAKNILDFSAGWGGRLLGMAFLEDTTYIGIDTNKDLKKGYNKMINDLGIKSRVKMLWQDSSKVDYSKYNYDFVFTSPPYFTIEKYKNMPEYKTKEDFMEKFYIPVINNVWSNLKMNGTMAINIPAELYELTKPILGASHKKVQLHITKRRGVGASKTKPYKEYIYFWFKKMKGGSIYRPKYKDEIVEIEEYDF